MVDNLGRSSSAKDWVDFMIIPDKTAKLIREKYGLDVKGYTCTLLGENNVHAFNGHGEGKEKIAGNFQSKKKTY